MGCAVAAVLQFGGARNGKRGILFCDIQVKASMAGPTPRDTTEMASAIGEIMALLGAISDKLELTDADSRRWMAENAPDSVVAALMKELTPTSFRVLNEIGADEPVNGITIAERSGVPKGTVSKTTRRLLIQQLITRESVPGNRKEVLFRLTPVGRQLFDLHRAFDARMQDGLVHFLERHPPEQLEQITAMLRDLSHYSFLYPDS